MPKCKASGVYKIKEVLKYKKYLIRDKCVINIKLWKNSF